MAYGKTWPSMVAHGKKPTRNETAEHRFREQLRCELERYRPEAVDVLGARWFVAQTLGGSERIVAGDLIEEGFRAYCPLERDLVFRARVMGSAGRIRRVRMRPVFMGYLFVGVPFGCGLAFGKSSHERIIDVLGAFEPLEIPAGLVAAVNAREIAGEWDHAPKQRQAPFKPGASVRVKDGAFAGFAGVVKGLPTDMRVKIEGWLFGRPTIVMVEALQLEAVAL